DPGKKCNSDVFLPQERTGTLMFVNSGGHPWLSMTLGSDRRTANLAERIVVTVDGQQIALDPTRAGVDNRVDSEMKVRTPTSRLVRIAIDRGDLAEIGIAHV